MMENSDKNDIPFTPPYLSWLFPYKRKGMSVSTKSPFMYFIFQNKISLLIINWTFQGMRGMGTADFIGKIILEILLIAILFPMMSGPVENRVVLAILIAHTVNWLFNSHFWDTGRFLGITRTDPGRFFPYLRRVVTRIKRDDDSSLPIGIIIGGLSRNRGFAFTSDVDMIFIRGRGLKNALTAVLVTIRERVIAFFCKFPLHLELYDDIDAMMKHRVDEVPVILKDADNTARNWYRKAGRDISFLDDYEGNDQ